ncbi:MAG: DUF2267 domain-containing protein [Elusimicrobia bacterium]|nr:DUF2267 domain-containing protein [Elusimicrobiota bacterium]
MAIRKPEILSSSVQKANLWLKDVERELHDSNRLKAYSTLRAVLHALRDSLPVYEAAHLAAQMPLLVRGIFFDGWKPRPKPARLDKQQFYGRIRTELRNQSGLDPALAAAAVIRTLYLHISAGELATIRDVLPREMRGLWEEIVESVGDSFRTRIEEPALRGRHAVRPSAGQPSAGV